MERVFGTLELRSVNDEKRTFEGIANTASEDSHGTVIEPTGARFALPIPLLFHHDQETPVGEITEARLVNGAWHVKGYIQTVTEPGFVKDITDRAWHNVKYRLMRGLSIGFAPLKQQANRFLEWAWRELSIVTIPSNQDANILAVRSAFVAASGAPSVSPGVSGIPNHNPRHGKMTIAESITQYENTRAAKVAARDALIQKAGEEGRTLEASEQESFDNLDTDIRSIDDHLVRLNTVKLDNDKRATPVIASTPAAASQSRGGVAVTVTSRATEPGILMARHVMSLAVCNGNKLEAAEYAKRTWGDGMDEVVRGLREGIMTRAAVAPGTTTNSTFAAPLVPTNYAQDFLDLLRPKTVLGRIPGLRHVPFNTSMAAQTAGGTFKWVGQGKMKPVTNAQYAAVTLGSAKASGIVVLTEELVRQSSPSAEASVRDSMVKDCANFLDAQFLDSTVAAVANVNPASITNGVTGTAATGTDVADARSNIAARIQAFSDLNYDLGELVIIMSQSMAFALGTMVNSVGNPAFPGLGINGGSILGVPVITGGNVGSQIVFAIAPSILMADEGGIEVDVSREASVELQETPTEPSDATTVLTSLWQANLVGIRVERFISWGKARTTAVDRITSAAYVP